MAKTDFQSVPEYIKAQPKDVQAVLRRVRAAIRKAVPRAEEVISYQIPGYKLHGGPVLYFAAWKRHYSLYPCTRGVVDSLGKALAGCKVVKSTIQFPFSQPVPVTLIARIARLRAKEEAERARARKAGHQR